jgi:hypothetical protein
VTQDFLGDVEAALELGDGFGRCVEDDDEVGSLVVRTDLVGQAAPAPRTHLDDLAAGGDDRPRLAVDQRLHRVIRRIRADDEHQLITSHE